MAAQSSCLFLAVSRAPPGIRKCERKRQVARATPQEHWPPMRHDYSHFAHHSRRYGCQHPRHILVPTSRNGDGKRGPVGNLREWERHI
jgi:hypothetical protein